MALGTITQNHNFVIGDRRAVVSDIVLSASYTTGGDALTAAQLGLPGGLLHVLDIGPANGYQVSYNYSTGKLMVYASAGTEATSTTNLSAITVRVIAIGKQMALSATEKWVSGFVVDTSGALVTTTSTGGAAWSFGWLRDPDGRLVVVYG